MTEHPGKQTHDHARCSSFLLPSMEKPALLFGFYFSFVSIHPGTPRKLINSPLFSFLANCSLLLFFQTKQWPLLKQRKTSCLFTLLPLNPMPNFFFLLFNPPSPTSKTSSNWLFIAKMGHRPATRRGVQLELSLGKRKK